ncbi:methyltransferase domain-containing protein [Actinophytocola sp.]|uniref:methyltransferase domain-containing protein n=1 Tax=Actinophytocola sp. TaxID=1872138 RepID=UPI00389A7A55
MAAPSVLTEDVPHPASINTEDPYEARVRTQAFLGCAHRMTVLDREIPFRARVRHRAMNGLGLMSSTYGPAVEIGCAPPIGLVTVNFVSDTMHIDDGGHADVANPGRGAVFCFHEDLTMRWAPGLRQRGTALRFHPHRPVRRRLPSPLRRVPVDYAAPVTVDAERYWDAQAPSFDEAPDHGLRDPAVRARWRELLLSALPPAPARIADLGCGTGSVTALLAGEGYELNGVDLSGAMVAAATAKVAAAGVTARIRQGDAASPPLEPAAFDVVFARHVLWALPDPQAVVARWIRLLRPNGRLVLVEGHWFTGAGLTADRCRELVAAHDGEVVVRALDDPRLWGGPITDERYLLVSRSQDA